MLCLFCLLRLFLVAATSQWYCGFPQLSVAHFVRGPALPLLPHRAPVFRWSKSHLKPQKTEAMASRVHKRETDPRTTPDVRPMVTVCTICKYKVGTTRDNDHCVGHTGIPRNQPRTKHMLESEYVPPPWADKSNR